jgi:hypothetical protein
MVKPKRLYLLGGTIALIIALAAGAQHLGHLPVTLPEQTALRVTIHHLIASDTSEPGEHFEAVLADPVLVNGKTVIPEGAEVSGMVIDAHPFGWLHGLARLNLALESVDVNGKSYEIHTAAADRVRGIALLGGGTSGGAFIGAPLGAGTGGAGLLLTGRKDIRIPAETHLTFRLTEPVTIG